MRIFDLKYDRAEEVGTNREMLEMPQSFPLPERKMEVEVLGVLSRGR